MFGRVSKSIRQWAPVPSPPKRSQFGPRQPVIMVSDASHMLNKALLTIRPDDVSSQRCVPI